MQHWLCLVCGSTIDVGEDDSFGACPHCGSNVIPADLAESADIHITWHELRILIFWAEFWASYCNTTGQGTETMHKVLYGIADRITMQHLDAPTLTFAGEVANLRSAGFQVLQDVVPEMGDGEADQ